MKNKKINTKSYIEKCKKLEDSINDLKKSNAKISNALNNLITATKNEKDFSFEQGLIDCNLKQFGEKIKNSDINELRNDINELKISIKNNYEWAGKKFKSLFEYKEKSRGFSFDDIIKKCGMVKDESGNVEAMFVPPNMFHAYPISFGFNLIPENLDPEKQFIKNYNMKHLQSLGSLSDTGVEATQFDFVCTNNKKYSLTIRNDFQTVRDFKNKLLDIVSLIDKDFVFSE